MDRDYYWGELIFWPNLFTQNWVERFWLMWMNEMRFQCDFFNQNSFSDQVKAIFWIWCGSPLVMQIKLCLLWTTLLTSLHGCKISCFKRIKFLRFCLFLLTKLLPQTMEQWLFFILLLGSTIPELTLSIVYFVIYHRADFLSCQDAVSWRKNLLKNKKFLWESTSLEHIVCICFKNLNLARKS